ncbi:DUF4942 domain-containing protein [Sphingomonas sp. 3-13AW]|uniref:DUF4942 domain-containing protein n=1 Tax=Sphingomonas sp. 3-13AW TaxID=3050450 RepID=UPI003BB61F94
MTGTALATRATIDEIVGYRTLAVEKFETAIAALDEAFETAAKAAGGARFHVDRDEAARAFSFGDRSGFLTYLRHQADRSVWDYLIRGFGFDKLMDRQAHQEFRAQLLKDPPEVTHETAEATLFKLVHDADRLFKRGIANAFAKLDRRFRSHDGFKLGDRVVLSDAFSEWGSWSHHVAHDETLVDIARAFIMLDDDAPRDEEGEKILPERHFGIVALVSEQQRGLERRAFVVEDDYFRVKAFKNGNAHVWFKRDDLLRKVNKLLGEYYGEVLGAGADAVEEDPLDRRSTAVAKNMGWFPTPEKVAHRIISNAKMNCAPAREGYVPPHYRVLEPSAGEGAIVKALREAMERSGASYDLDMVELHHGRVQTLRDMRFGKVIHDDFLEMHPDPIYDRILMNPPFDRGLDVDHVVHAVKFLAPGGLIVAVMAAGVEYRKDRKTDAFRKLVERMDGEIIDLPVGSFEESGTGVNTVLVRLRAPALHS